MVGTGIGSNSEETLHITSSSIATLFQQLAKMSKSPTIDANLSQVLDEFLEKLNESDMYLQNGIFNMNFAEAALLLQSSADLYGKKVDLLWECIFDYQQRIALSDEKNENNQQELQKIEERKRKYKRKRKINTEETQTKTLIATYSFGNCTEIDYLNQTYEQHNLSALWSKLALERYPSNDRENHDYSYEDSQFIPDSSIYNEDHDYIGRYNQLHSTSFIEYMESQLNPIKNMTPKLINLKQPTENFVTKESYVRLERLPFTLLRDTLRRSSLADSLLDGDNFSSVSDGSHLASDFNCNEPHHVNQNNCKECECDSEVAALVNELVAKVSSINSPLEDFDAEIIEAEENNEMPIEHIVRSIDNRNKSCSQDSAFYEWDDELDETLSRRSRSVVNTPALKTPIQANPITNTALCCGSTVVLPRFVKVRTFEKKVKEKQEKIKPPAPKKRRISEKLLKKLTTGITASRREFEKFCRLNYKPDEDEGEVPTEFSSDSESEISDIEADTVPDLFEMDNEEDNNDEDLSNNCEPPSSPMPLHNTENSSPQTNIDANLPVQNFSDPINEHEDESFRKNVSEWRSFILPKLRSMENRSDFDIHEYGAKIIEPYNVGQKLKFANLVSQSNPAEVARYFIATLQLANTNNIEISGAVPGVISNETFELTIKDKTRHHELLEEYQAPSEETFRERLERAKSMKSRGVLLHSTPSAVPPCKKVKLAKCSQKKLF